MELSQKVERRAEVSPFRGTSYVADSPHLAFIYSWLSALLVSRRDGKPNNSASIRNPYKRFVDRVVKTLSKMRFVDRIYTY